VFAQAELLKLQKSGQFPDEPVRIKVGQITLQPQNLFFVVQIFKFFDGNGKWKKMICKHEAWR
jgi:hypothetical protein